MTAPSFDEFRFVSGSVSRETFDRLIAFEAVFRRWAARINLVASVDAAGSVDPPYSRQRPAGANQARRAELARHRLRRWISRRSHGPDPQGKTGCFDRSGREQSQEGSVPADRRWRSSTLRRACMRGGSKRPMALFANRKSSRRGPWRRSAICLSLSEPWLGGRRKRTLPQRPGISERNQRKR